MLVAIIKITFGHSIIKMIRFKSTIGFDLREFFDRNREIRYMDNWPLIDLDGSVYYTFDYFKGLVSSVGASKTSRYYERVL